MLIYTYKILHITYSDYFILVYTSVEVTEAGKR